ncbi:MAG: hypothetical protein ACRBG0_27685 [Lewinella sp.]|uniref:hypothetical protein n=1 Tax=Lewinella sp. TaxID=2004506 RepID=UPI003D6A96C1
MKEMILAFILGGLIVYFSTKSETTKIEKEYIKGDTDTLIVRDTIQNDKIIYKNKIKHKIKYVYKKDSLKKVVKSTYEDSTDNYKIRVEAYSPLPVDSMKVFHTNFEKIVIKTRVDTLKTNTIEKDGYLNGAQELTIGASLLILIGLIL